MEDDSVATDKLPHPKTQMLWDKELIHRQYIFLKRFINIKVFIFLFPLGHLQHIYNKYKYIELKEKVKKGEMNMYVINGHNIGQFPNSIA